MGKYFSNLLLTCSFLDFSEFLNQIHRPQRRVDSSRWEAEGPHPVSGKGLARTTRLPGPQLCVLGMSVKSCFMSPTAESIPKGQSPDFPRPVKCSADHCNFSIFPIWGEKSNLKAILNDTSENPTPSFSWAIVISHSSWKLPAMGRKWGSEAGRFSKPFSCKFYFPLFLPLWLWFIYAMLGEFHVWMTHPPTSYLVFPCAQLHF